MTGAGQGAVVPEFSCDENGRFSVEWCRSNTHVLTVTADDDAQMYFSASHGVGLTSSGRWELGEEPPQSFYYAYQAVVGAALSAYDAKCEELARIVEQPVGKYVDRMVEKRCEELEAERDAAHREKAAAMGLVEGHALTIAKLEAERDAAVRERDDLLAALKAIRDLRCSSFRTYEQDSKDMRRIAGDAIDAQLSALAPPTEQQKVEA